MKTETAYGSPSWEIINRADEWKPDLIVIGSHGRSAIGRFALGSVSQKVLTEARCSVRIVKGSGASGNVPVRILIGVDGSDASKAAVSEVASLRWHKGSSANVLIVDEPIAPNMVGVFVPSVASFVDEMNSVQEETSAKVVKEAIEQLRAAGLEADGGILLGNPKRELVWQAKEWDADCIFVGSVGFNNILERFLLGSVSAAVAARAHCCVEVVRVEKK